MISEKILLADYISCRIDKLWVKCSEHDACHYSKQTPITGRIIWNDDNNWTRQYNYYCENAFKRTESKSLVVMSNAVEAFVFLFLADHIGRRAIFYLSFLVIMIGIATAYYANDIQLKIYGMAVSGGFEIIFASLLSMIVNESTSKIFTNFFKSSEYKN